EQVGLARCAGVMRAAGVGLPDGAIDRAGLSLVVGGVEVTLLDLVTAFATIGRGGTHRPLRLLTDEPVVDRPALDRQVCAALDEILSSRARCPRGLEDRPADSMPWFMWKTGTSSGRRDAWAVGHNRRLAIGVWVGRFDGGGHADYIGGLAAEPLLAALFSDPRLRGRGTPPAAVSWTVANPLPPPREWASSLRILTPRDGTEFHALGATAVVPVTVNRGEGLHWFLDGTLLTDDPCERLLVAPGRHELRCVDPSGQYASTVFTVRGLAP
ncbi:MAG: hypothetical protein ACYTGC_11105, partial [Planctomycetota bacterium]